MSSILEQINRIRDKLRKIPGTDPHFREFGSESHRYRLNRPASESSISIFERRLGITLPEGYRLFVGKVAEGGAGPHYGLYRLKETLSQIDNRPNLPCRIYPGITEAQWNDLVDRIRRETGFDDEIPAVDLALDGLLLIGTQGCTYYNALVLNGKHEGRVAYVDIEAQAPRFAPELSFPDWYEHWLDKRLGMTEQGFSR